RAETGARSSWETREAKRRCADTAFSRRSRYMLEVRANSAISSSPGGAGTRRLRSVAVASRIVALIACIGESVRPTTTQVPQAATAVAISTAAPKPIGRYGVDRAGGSG